MTQFTHPICDDCWDRLKPESRSPRQGEGFIEHCCWCGTHTVSGIYLREDPEAIRGHVAHHPGQG